MNRLEEMFAPRSLAVIGASRKPGSLGKMFLDAVVQMKYTGKVFPVNPKADEISGIKCFPSINELPEKPDLAVILLPKDFVFPALRDLAARGTQNVVIISAGFREVGPEGLERERQLVAFAREHNIRLIGPNSMGLFNTAAEISLNATFSPTAPQAGHVAFISQSGALGVAVLELTAHRSLSFSVFVSTGNKADVSDVDVLEFLEHDENTHAIILYLESIDRPEAFRAVCSRLASKKPILVLKAGRTESGLKAASSHTGALASTDVAADAFLKQCGVLRCDSLDELMDSAEALAQPLPRGKRFAVITNAGGPGILASDALEQEGIELPEIGEQTALKLRAVLPAEASVHNPVDMIASANHETYARVSEILLQDDSLDGLFVIIVKPPVNATAEQILEKVAQSDNPRNLPIYATVMAQTEDDKILQFGVPVFRFPEAAARAAGNAIRYSILRGQVSPFTEQAPPAVGAGQTYQAQLETVVGLLEDAGLPIAKSMITGNVNEAKMFFNDHSRVVLKVANASVIHKSDAGLVVLNIADVQSLEIEFKALCERIKNAIPSGEQPLVLVQEMAGPGTELVIGGRRDAQFGPMVMVGLGGVLVEALKDVAFRIYPFDRNEALRMIAELHGHNILQGFRNLPRVDENLLADMLVKTGQMMTEHSEIQELDMNPVIWQKKSSTPVIVDCRMTLAEPAMASKA